MALNHAASAAVVASGFVTADCSTRDWPSAPAKSARSPATPVSMTATPTPLPVTPVLSRLFHALAAWVDFGYVVSRLPADTACERIAPLRETACTRASR